MNKGQTIRKLITEGMENDDILLMVDTTLNSIRWHRSKMQQAPLPRIEDVVPVMVTDLLPPTVPPKPPFYRRTGKTVGEALREFGLMHELDACLDRLGAMRFYDEIIAWSFVTNAKVTGRFGQCSYRKKQIEVHATLLDNKPLDLKQTFLHELAHALDKMIHGKSSHHGYNWKMIMSRGFRLDPQRCGDHTGEAEKALLELKAKKAVETWVCTGCGAEHPIMRKRKYPASNYRHTKCGSAFRVK